MSRIGDDSAAERNKTPIFEALAPWLAGARRVLEVGAGDATHARHAIRCFSEMTWQTSEAPGHHRRLVAALAGIEDRRLPRPLSLDVRGRWPEGPFDAVYGANVAHIMSWAAVEALFRGAGAMLAPGGLLCLYGPFRRRSAPVEPSNQAFDEALRARDPDMGLRALEALVDLGERSAMELVDDIAMPSRNHLLIWRRFNPD